MNTEITPIDTKSLSSLVKNTEINTLTVDLMEQPQVSCPVTHTFGPGVYVREVVIPAGTFAIGSLHKEPQLNIFLKGKMLVPDPTGEMVEITAPMMYTAMPGQKAGYALEDVTWLEVIATSETDIPALEDRLVDIPDSVRITQENRLLDEPRKQKYLPSNEEAVYAFKDPIDPICIDMPYGSYKFARGNSAIGEKGIYCTGNITIGEVIGVAWINDDPTVLGRYIDHSEKPTAYILKDGNRKILISKANMVGNKGSMKGDNITINFKEEVSICQ